MSSELPIVSDVPASYADIKPGTYTALRLQHASVEHLNLTTRRCFVGPIPEGWLNTHRKAWYREYFGLSNYSSKTATFSTSNAISRQRQITGLDGPSVTATYAKSFPQPDDIEDEDDDVQGETDDTEGEEDEAENEGEGAEESVDADHANTDGPADDSGQRGGRRPAIRINVQADQSNEDDGGEAQNDRSRQVVGLRPPSARRKASATNESFVTAREKPVKGSKVAGNGSTVRSAASFVTAKEFPRDATKSQDKASPPTLRTALEQIQQSPTRSSMGSQIRISNELEDSHGSKTGLLSASKSQPQPESPIQPSDTPVAPPKLPGMVKFHLDGEDEPLKDDQILERTATKLSQAADNRIWRRLRRGTAHPGEIVRMEKMLVRVDATMHQLPKDFDENDSVDIEFRTIDKWREFIVVCRESTSDDCHFALQLYKTRVIPARAETHVDKHTTHEIPLSPKNTRVNLYSSLDKTLVIWAPWRKGSTMIYILRSHSSASAVEWHTFIRSALGWNRPKNLQVYVPDLDVTLQLENPFIEFEGSLDAAKDGPDAVQKTMEAEKAVSHTIIQRSLAMLQGNPEWATILSSWLSKERIGLAWKRYDRLEWVHGANEQKMYGSMAMQRTHELELRPKEHYPTQVRHMKEPAPVEGFLIRLTSQRGTVRRFGKMYFKRLYFVTHNQYLCYMRPAKAQPPPPPEPSLKNAATAPSTRDILDGTPLVFAVKPYPDDNEDGEVDWVQYGSAQTKERRDVEAYKESERQINTLLRAEGYINLSHVSRVQDFHRATSDIDNRLGEGGDVDFHQEVADTHRNDGKTQAIDDERVFELVMHNGLVVRLQAYDKVTKKEWIQRLRKLVHYWKLRLADDLALLKSVRAENLKKHNINEEMEAYLGQFGEKWEVTRSMASPKIFHMCGISCCRAITMSGTLYYKPRRHTTFLRTNVILCHGRLLIFRGVLRSRTGNRTRNIQHDRQASIELRKCYIYSGLITGDDLLYQNESFDSNHPGHTALPKIYLEDGWTSRDEDTMTCFVIWQPRDQSWFRASEEEDSTGRTRQHLRHVSRLGATGRSIVFRTRSRAERDHWVMNIGMEIERLRDHEDIRVVEKG